MQLFPVAGGGGDAKLPDTGNRQNRRPGQAQPDRPGRQPFLPIAFDLQRCRDDEIEKSEGRMMAYVYAAIVVLVFVVYRDLRAVIACCLPLTVGTSIGYWFMKELQIGLTVAKSGWWIAPR